MKYKMVVKTPYNTYVKERSKSKDHLIQQAEVLSKKHPKWEIFVVAENTII